VARSGRWYCWPAIEDWEYTLAGAPRLLAAIGAMGHELVDIADPTEWQQRMGELLVRVRGVRWDKGRQWEGIAGKCTPKGTFSVGGTKETAYAIYTAPTTKRLQAMVKSAV
jgi:hypothetical protein